MISTLIPESPVKPEGTFWTTLEFSIPVELDTRTASPSLGLEGMFATAATTSNR